MATTTGGSAVNAADFNEDTKDSLRHEWNAGAMRHLVAALGDTTVAIVLDKRTGHSRVNVRLKGVRKTPGYGTFQVLVQEELSDGKIYGCWHPLSKVGTVIILGDSQARWTALETYRVESATAWQKAHEMWAKKYEGRTPPCGEWEIRPGAYHVTVSFRPTSLRDQFDYWNFTPRALQGA